MTSQEQPVERRDVTRLDPDKITEIALGLAQGRYFSATEAPDDLLGAIFLPVTLGGLDHLKIDQIGNIVEELSKAGPRSINGYPIFFSCQVIHKDDWAVIVERATKAFEAMQAAAGGA